MIDDDDDDDDDDGFPDPKWMGMTYHDRCQARARPGTYSGEWCGLSADETGYCWWHRDG